MTSEMPDEVYLLGPTSDTDVFCAHCGAGVEEMCRNKDGSFYFIHESQRDSHVARSNLAQRCRNDVDFFHRLRIIGLARYPLTEDECLSVMEFHMARLATLVKERKAADALAEVEAFAASKD